MVEVCNPLFLSGFPEFKPAAEVEEAAEHQNDTGEDTGRRRGRLVGAAPRQAGWVSLFTFSTLIQGLKSSILKSPLGRFFCEVD